MTLSLTDSHNGLRRASAWVLVLLAVAAVVVLVLQLRSRTGTRGLWVGSTLGAQLAERLGPSRSAAGLPVGAYEPASPLTSWRIVSAQASSNTPLWQAVFDDDPAFALTVNVEVEYATGQRALLQWSTWRYGLLLGPWAIFLGDGPPGELTRLPDAAAP